MLHAQSSTPFSSTAIAGGKSCLLRANAFSVQSNGVRKRGQKTCRGMVSSCWVMALGSGGGIPGRCWAGADCFFPTLQTLLECPWGSILNTSLIHGGRIAYAAASFVSCDPRGMQGKRTDPGIQKQQILDR